MLPDILSRGGKPGGWEVDWSLLFEGFDIQLNTRKIKKKKEK